MRPTPPSTLRPAPGRFVVHAVGTVLLAAGALAGCGFVHASGVSQVKPNAFVLRGHVTVPVPAPSGLPSGSPCTAPPGASDVIAGARVTVTNPAGTTIALGRLGPGVAASGKQGETCDFPFTIRGVPGGVTSYGVAVANRPAHTYAAQNLREDGEAVVPVSPSPSAG